VTAPALSTEHVFDIRALIGEPRSGAAGRLGQRLHIPITGGEVRGPRLTGRILPGGSDWVLCRRDGSSLIDAHYTIEADDGTPIYVRNRGLRVSSADVLERLRKGDPVSPEEMYFRSAPEFDAPEGPHGWLSDSLFVARLSREAGAVLVRVFRVC